MIRKRIMSSRILAAAITVTMLFTSIPVKASAIVLNEDKIEVQQSDLKKSSVSGQKFTGSEDGNKGPIDLAPSIKDENKKEGPHIEESEFKKASEMDLKAVHDPEEKVTIIVELEKESLLDAGYSTSQIAEGARAVSYANSQQNHIEIMEARIEDEIDDELEVLYEYKVAITGIAVSTEYKNLESIKNMSGIKDAWVSPVYYLSDDVETFTSNASTMIGANKVWNETGYTGQGMKIAIIDTGIYLNHDSFKPLSDDKLTEDSMKEDNVYSIWNKLNASKYTVRPIGVYRNTKVPYAYNYFTHNLDVAHTASDHGTHVAGIAAANKIDTTDVVGIAPDAQLAVMQVFSPQGGADFTDILAAMEDAVYLNVDVMNLSLGSTAGFTDSDKVVNDIFDKFAQTDIQVAIAAGNDTSNALNNLYGNNLSLSKNPDIGLVGNPGSYTDPMTVGSVDNTAIKAFTISVDGKNIAYNDTATTNHTNFLSALGISKEYDYVWLGEDVYGGNVNEFKNANNGSGVEGKIALVSRGGGVSFMSKQTNAKDAGAVGCIIYNTDDGTLNMQVNDGKDHIPCVSISKNDGQYMIEKFNGGKGKLTTSNGDQQTVINDKINMSSFSSWGVTPSLKLKPDITGVGGNIYSTRDNNTYGLMSGTSMATPQVAGAAAIVMEYVKAKFEGLSEQQIRNVTSALLMSTANPVLSGEMEYSPRWQGAGLLNLQDVVTTKAYLTSNEQEDGRPKAELGDSKDGSYKFGFKVNNITDKPLAYELDSNLLTEGTVTNGDKTFMTSSPVKLDSKVSFDYDESLKYDFNDDDVINTADVRVLLATLNGEEGLSKRPESFMDVNGDGKFDKADSKELAEYAAELEVAFDHDETALVVPANGSLDCSGAIDLAKSDKEYMDANFENGIYVDGFVYVKSLNNDITELSMPLMGFYGDWTAPSIFDEGVNHYWDSEGEASLFPRGIYTKLFMLGVNPYVKSPYDENHSAVSLDNGLDEIDIGLLRNAKELKFTVTDDNTGEEYWSYTEHDVSKTYFNSSQGMIIPYFIVNPQTGDPILWDGKDKEGNPVEDNTKVKLKVEAKLDYEGENKVQSFEQPIWVDNSKPSITNIENLKPEIKDGKVTLNLSLNDNRYIAAVLFESPDGAIMAKHNIEDYEPGKEKEYTFDISGFGEDFNIIVADYACNEYVQEVNLDLGAGWNDNELPLSKLDKEKLYAFESSSDGAVEHGWYSANKSDLSEAKNITYSKNARYYSAEYIDGYVYAQNTVGELVVIPPRNTYWKENVLNKQTDVILYDMAFDYSTKTLYAVGWDYSIGEGGVSVLAKIDLTSGEVTRVAALNGMDSTTMVTLGCTTEGQLYGIDMTGNLYKIPKEQDNGKTEKIGMTDFAKRADFYGVNTIQSMAYDHNTNTMYWDAFSSKTDINTNATLRSYGVYKVNLSTGESTLIGDMKNNCGVGLFIPYDGGDILPDSVKPVEVSIANNMDTISMLPTQTRTISLSWKPWNAVQSPVEWTIRNQKPVKEGEQVATVNNKGKVTAISEGTATVEAKTKIYPESKPEGYETTLSVKIKVLESTDEMYGFLLSDLNDMNKGKNSWITFKDSSPEKYEIITKGAEKEMYAGAYYNGYIYSVFPGQGGDDFYKTKVTKPSSDEKASFGELEYIGSMPETNITDMAFDYTTGRMYAIENKQSFMYLSIIDLETGKLDRVSVINDIIVGLACDGKGNLYGINTEGKLLTFDSETGESTLVYDTGVTTEGYIQSMTYDYNSGNLYWAQCQGIGSSSFYLLANITTTDELGSRSEWQTVKLGDIGGKKGAEISGLFTIPKDEPEAQYIPVTGISIDQNEFTMLSKSKAKLSATTTPKRPTIQTKTWTSSDENILKVDEEGVVTAVNTGKATIKVAITDRESKKTYEDSVEITVLESSGDLKAFLNQDLKSSYYNWWVSIPDYDPASFKTVKSAIDSFSLTAGDYYDGYIYAYDKDGKLYRISADNYRFKEIGSYSNDNYNFNITDMTYDYENFRMLALSLEDYSGSQSTIYSVDLENGSLTKLVDTKEVVYGLAYGNGEYYAVKGNGMLCSVNLETGDLTEVLDTGKKVKKYNYGYNTTLAYDHNSDRLYMAPIAEGDPYAAGQLTMIDVKGKVSMPLGNIGKSGALVCAMYIEPKDGSVPEDKNVRKVMLDKENVKLEIGANATITPEILPSTAENKEVTWTTSNKDVATVENGVITAVGLGSADITVTTVDGGYTSKCKVTVLDPKETSGDTAYAFSKDHGGLIRFNPDLPSSSVKLLTSYDKTDKVLASTFVDGALYYLMDMGSGYPKLYKMDINSYIPQEIGFVGMEVGPANDMTYDPLSEIIYITSGFYIYAIDPATGSVINSVNISNNSTHGLTATNGYIYIVANDGNCVSTLFRIDINRILKASYGELLNPNEDYYVVGALNPSVHTSTDSKVEINFANRKVYLTADDKIYSIDIMNGNVEEIDSVPSILGLGFITPKDFKPGIYVTGVSLDKNDIKLKPGMTKKLTATVYPDNDKVNKEVTWSSDNDAVVKVDNNGMLTAVTKGNANVTVTTKDGGFTASCKVTVVEAGNENWMYGYSIDEKAFIRFDVNNPDVDGEKVLAYDAGVTSGGQQIYPRGTEYLDGYVYFANMTKKDTWNLYRWNMKDNSVEEFMTDLKNEYGYSMTIADMAVIGKELYIMGSTGLYVVNTETKTLDKVIKENSWSALAITAIGNNTIVGQMGNGRQIIYTKTEEGWTASRPNKYNNLIVEDEDYYLSSAVTLNDVMYICSGRKLYTLDYMGYNASKVGDIGAGKLSSIFVVPTK